MSGFELDTSGEQWLPVVGYEGSYEVSDLGRVRSLTRAIVRGGSVSTLQGALKSPKVTKTGYLHVHLSTGDKRTCMTVHRLVAKAFLPNSGAKPAINHLDNDRQNNRIDNLEWCSHAENMAHAAAQLRLRGKLSAAAIAAIRAAYPGLDPEGKKRLAKTHGVTVGHVHKIGRDFAHRHHKPIGDDGLIRFREISEAKAISQTVQS